jgi:hypothetical protein
MSDEDTEICGEPYKHKDGICDNPAKHEDGKCGRHSEYTNVGRTKKHGLADGTSRSEYYESLPGHEKGWIDEVAKNLLEKSYFGEDDAVMVEKCRQIAIDLHQKRRADGYVAKKGLTQEKTVGFHEDYGEITETQENVLMITKDRLSRETRLSMKDLGVFDQEDEASVESGSVLEQLSEEMNS